MAYMNFLKDLASEAGEVIKDNFKLGMEKEFKEDNTPLTVTDTKINSMVIEKVSRYYPNHSVKGEEEDKIVEGSDYVWVCDPVDGTIAFSTGIPICTFSIALVYKGKPIAGVIYDPFMDRMLVAEEGKGAFLNGESISVSTRDKLNQHTTFSFENFKFAKYDFGKLYLEMVEQLNPKAFSFCSVLYGGILLAVGEIDAVLFPGITSHDGAALKIIVEEAGGKMTDIYGDEQNYDTDINGYIATNGLIHDQLIEMSKKYVIKR